MINIWSQMTPAMLGYLSRLIYRNTRTSRVCLASLSDLAHDQLYRLLYADFPYSRRLWEFFAVKLIGEIGYLVLDDITWQRWTKKAEFVLFDSWYGAGALLELIDSFGWHYIAAAKRNRLFEGVKIGNYFRHRFGRAVGKLRKISHQILLVKDGQKFLMTNEISLTSRAVKSHYRFRQQVEETFRLLKQEFGWGKCRARSVTAQAAHLHLGLYALCLVQMKVKGETVYRFKQNLFRQAIPTQDLFIQAFTVSA